MSTGFYAVFSRDRIGVIINENGLFQLAHKITLGAV